MVMMSKEDDYEGKEKEEKDEDSVYDEEGREELVESDEVSPEEQAFMQGYEDADEEKEEKEEKKEEEE